MSIEVITYKGMPMILDDKVRFRTTSPDIRKAVRSIFRQLKSDDPVPRRIALRGTFTPRRCGIATFCTDVVEQLALFQPHISVDVYALDDPLHPLRYDGAHSSKHIGPTVRDQELNDVALLIMSYLARPV